MRENEFERKVQEQMDQLRLRPSDEVWIKVEKEIREKKKRRVVFIIFFLAGLGLLGYSGYTLLKPGTDKQVAAQTQPATNNSTNNNNNTSTDKTAVAQKPQTPIEKEITVDNNQSPGPIKKSTDSKEPSNKIISIAKNGLSKEQTPKRKIKTNKPAVEDDIVVNNKPAKEEITTVKIENDTEIITDNKDIAVTTVPPAITSVDTSVAIISAPDSAITKNDIQLNEDSLKTEAIDIAKNKKTVSPKIRFGIEFSEGVTSSRKNLIGIDLGGMKSLNDANNIYQAPGTNGSATPGRVIQPPSDVRSRSGWRLGVVAEKKFNKRVSATGGLRYTYISEKIKVGAARNVLLQSNSYAFAQNFQINRGWSYYSSASQISYKIPYVNKYHFFEMPLQFQYQLNKGKKMGIVWSMGLTPGLLMATNSLVYDTTAGGVYYRNDDAFKRFHLNTQTGFAFRFGAEKKIQWSIGPDISLDMTRLMREDVFTDRRYLLYAGLTGRVFFLRTKK